MAGRSGEHRHGGSGTAGGTDLEPLRGGMDEVDSGDVGPEHAHEGAREEAPAPYHAFSTAEGARAPDDSAGEGGVPQRAPEKSPTELQREAADKLVEERRDHENEAANARRDDPGAKGAGERR
jgi:hypothetical protein